MPLLAKDPLKEILFDTLGWSDRVWSRRLGVAVYPVLFEAAAKVLLAGRSLVLEANFDNERARSDFLALPPARVVQVYCTAPPEVLLTRFDERARSGVRHPAHGGMTDDVQARIRGGDFGPLDLDGPRFDLMTEPFADLSLAQVVAVIDPPECDAAVALPSEEVLARRLRESFAADEVSDAQLRGAAARIARLFADELGG